MKHIIFAIVILVIIGVILTAISPKKICSDFDNQRQALRFFTAHGSEYASLDRDHDLIPCESLPK